MNSESPCYAPRSDLSSGLNRADRGGCRPSIVPNWEINFSIENFINRRDHGSPMHLGRGCRGRFCDLWECAADRD